MSSQKARIHINSMKSGRTPVFVLNAQGEKHTVNIRSCAFNTSFYNISYNNNIIRWLRKVNTSVNNNVLTYYPDSTGVINPYIASSSKPLAEWHLCELRIPPGTYTTTDAIIDAINKSFSESVKNLLNIKTTQHQATTNASLSYDNLLPNDEVLLLDTNLTNVNVITDDDIGYISDKSLIYDYKDENEQSIRQNSPYRVVNLHKISTASLQNAKITHPAFSNNLYTFYKEENDINVKDTPVLFTSNDDNTLNEFSILSTDAVIVDVNGLKGKSVDVTKGIFKSFPRFIGLDDDENKLHFSDTAYNYTRNFNKNMQILLDANVTFTNITDKNQYSKVGSGVLKLYDDTYTSIDHDWRVYSPISYTADILNNVEYRFYYDDNSLDDNNLFYFVNIEGNTDENGCVADRDIPNLILQTNTPNKPIKIIHGTDVDGQHIEITGFEFKKLPNAMDSYEIPTANIESDRTTNVNMKALSMQQYSGLVDINNNTINIPKYNYYECDGNGLTQNVYNADGVPNNNELYYSDKTLTMQYYKCDLSQYNIAAVEDSISIEDAQAIYYDSKKDKYTFIADGTYTEDEAASFVVCAHKVIVSKGIISTIIVKQSDVVVKDDESIDVYYKHINERYEVEFSNTAHDNNFDLVSTTITNTNTQEMFSSTLVPYNINEQPVNGIYNTGINNAYYVAYGTNTDINKITLRQKSDNTTGSSTAGRVVATQKIFADCVDKNITFDVDITKFKPVRYSTDSSIQHIPAYNKINEQSYDNTKGVYIYNNETESYALIKSVFLNNSTYSTDIYSPNIMSHILTAKFDVDNVNGQYVKYEDEYYKMTGNLYSKSIVYVNDDPDNSMYMNLKQFNTDSSGISSVSTQFGTYTLETVDSEHDLIQYFDSIANNGQLSGVDGIYVETEPNKTQYDKRHDIIPYVDNGEGINGKLVPKIELPIGSDNASKVIQTTRSNYQEIELGTNTYYKSKNYVTNHSAPEFQYFDVNTFKNLLTGLAASAEIIAASYRGKVFYTEYNANKHILMILDENGYKLSPETDFSGLQTISITTRNSDGTYRYDNRVYDIYKYPTQGTTMTRMDTPSITINIRDVYIYSERPYISIPQRNFETYYFNNHYYYVRYYNDKYIADNQSENLDGCVVTKISKISDTIYKYIDNDNVEYHVTCIDGTGDSVYPEKILFALLDVKVNARDVNFYTRSMEYVVSDANTHDFTNLFKYYAEDPSIESNFKEYSRNINYYQTFKLAVNDIPTVNSLITMNNALIVDFVDGSKGIDINLSESLYNYIENATNTINLETNEVRINGNTININVNQNNLEIASYSFDPYKATAGQVQADYNICRMQATSNDNNQKEYYVYIPIDTRYQEYYRKFNYDDEIPANTFIENVKYYRNGTTAQDADKVTTNPRRYQLMFTNTSEQATGGTIINYALCPKPLIIDISYALHNRMLYKVSVDNRYQVLTSIEYDTPIYVKLGGVTTVTKVSENPEKYEYTDQFNNGEQFIRYTIHANDTLITINKTDAANDHAPPIIPTAISDYKYVLKDDNTETHIDVNIIQTYHYVDPEDSITQLLTQSNLNKVAKYLGMNNFKARTITVDNLSDINENEYTSSVDSDHRAMYIMYNNILYRYMPSLASDYTVDEITTIDGIATITKLPDGITKDQLMIKSVFKSMPKYVTNDSTMKYYYAYDGLLFVDLTKQVNDYITNLHQTVETFDKNNLYVQYDGVADNKAKYELFNNGVDTGYYGFAVQNITYTATRKIHVEDSDAPIFFTPLYTNSVPNCGSVLQRYEKDPYGTEYLIDGYHKSTLLSTIDNQPQYWTYEEITPETTTDYEQIEKLVTIYIRFENVMVNKITSPFYLHSDKFISGITPTVDYYIFKEFTHDFMYFDRSSVNNQAVSKMVPLVNTKSGGSDSEITCIGLFNILTHQIIYADDIQNNKIFSKYDNYMILIEKGVENLNGFAIEANSYNDDVPYVCINNNYIVECTDADEIFTIIEPKTRVMASKIEMLKLSSEDISLYRGKLIQTIDPITIASNDAENTVIRRATHYNNQPIIIKSTYSTLMNNNASNLDTTGAIIYRQSTDGTLYHNETGDWYMKRITYTPNNASASSVDLYVKLHATIDLPTFPATNEISIVDSNYPALERLNTPSNYPDNYLLAYVNTPIDNSIYLPISSINYVNYVDRFIASSDYPEYIKISDSYKEITNIYEEIDDYVYVQINTGATIKIFYNGYWGYITTNSINNLLADILAKKDQYTLDSNVSRFDGYIKINDTYHPLTSFDTFYSGSMEYTEKSDEDVDSIIYIRVLLNDDTEAYTVPEYYQMTIHDIISYTYEEDNKRYILPLRVKGTSSRTNIEYEFGLNVLFNSRIVVMDNDNIKPSANTKFRLIGLSLNDKVMLKADVNNDLCINFSGTDVKVNEIITIEQLESYYPNSIIDKTYLQNLIHTDLNDATIEYNNDLIDCNLVYKISNLTFSNANSEQFYNIDNKLFTEQTAINTSPTNNENYGVVAYSKSYKCHPNELDTPLSETIENGITYTTESGESNYSTTENVRSYIYKPFDGDHDTDSFKNTEWIDAKILANSNITDKTFKNNYYIHLPDGTTNYSPKSQAIENKIFNILNAFEYNPGKHKEDKFVQKSLSVLSLDNDENNPSPTKRIVKRKTLIPTPTTLTVYDDDTPVGEPITMLDSFYMIFDGKLDVINGNSFGIISTTNSQNMVPVTLDYDNDKSYDINTYAPFYHIILQQSNLKCIRDLSITPISGTNKFRLSFKTVLSDAEDDLLYVYDNVTLYYYNQNDSSSSMTLNPTISASLKEIQCIVQFNGTQYSYNTKYVVFEKSTSLTNQSGRLQLKSFKTSHQIIKQNDTIARVYGNQDNNTGDILNIITTMFQGIEKTQVNKVMCLGKDVDGLFAPMSMNEGTFVIPQDVCVNGTNIIQIGIRTEKDPNITPYFSAIDPSTLFYDRDLKIPYKYGHYISSGENIYAHSSDHVYVYRIHTSYGNANIPLENKTVMYVYSLVENPYNHTDITYLDTNTYESVDDCVIMPLYKQVYKTVPAIKVVNGSPAGYKHRYIRYFTATQENSDDPIGVFVEDANGKYVLTGENQFYNLDNLIPSEEFTFTCTSKNLEELQNAITPSLTADYRKQVFTAGGNSLVTTSPTKYAYIKGKVYGDDTDVNEVVVFEVDEHTTRYTYIPLKTVPYTVYNGKYYDSNTCKFYDESKSFTPATYENSPNNYYVHNASDIQYVQICDAAVNAVNYNELKIEANGINSFKLFAHRIITSDVLLRCGNFVYIDSSFSNTIIDDNTIGYYDYYAMIAHPTKLEYITSFYAQTIEASERGDLYTCVNGMYVVGDTNFYQVTKVDDVNAIDSTLFNYLKGDVVIDFKRASNDEYKTYRVKLTSTSNTRDVPTFTSLTLKDIITGEEKTVTNGEYFVVAIMEGTIISLDNMAIGLAQYIHKSILPKAMDGTYLYSSNLTIAANTVYQSPITQTLATGMSQCVDNDDFMFRLADLTKLDVDSFVHYHIYHENIQNARVQSSAISTLNHITSMNVAIKTFCRKYASPLVNTIQLTSFKEPNMLEKTLITNNVVPESIFSSANTVDITDSEHYVNNINVKDKFVTSTMYITDDSNNEVGVFLHLGDEYNFKDYYYSTSIDLLPNKNEDIYSKGSVENYAFSKDIMRKDQYNIAEKTYYNLEQYYAYSGPTTFEIDSSGKNITFGYDASKKNLSEISNDKLVFAYSLYKRKSDAMNVQTNINISATSRVSSDNMQNMLKVVDTKLTHITDFTHNTEIYPKGDITIDFNAHNFRIRANPQPNVYDVNVYNDGESSSLCTFMMDGNRFVVKSFVDGVMTDVPYTSSKLRLLNIADGTVTEGTLTAYKPANTARYMNLSNITETSVTTNEIQSNKQLIYDEYYNKILSDNFDKLFTKQDVDGNTFTKISTDFSCILVSSDTLYSKQSDFKNLMKTTDFDEDYDTQLMPAITVFNKSKYEVSKNVGLLNKYDAIDGGVDDFYYNFTVDEDILYRLGYLCPKISNDDKYYLNLNGKRAYVIKGKYYSECVYSGPLTLQNSEKIYNTITHDGKSIRKPLVLQEGYNILDLDSNLLDKFFNKSIFASQRLANLSIPTSVEVKLTQSNDVEKLINTADNYSTNALAIGEFPLNTRRELPYANIAQSIDINYTFDLPKSGKMYLYLTSPNQRYPIINSNSQLEIEYI